MAEPTTVNCGLIIPSTGDLTGTWGSAAINPDFVAVDGYFGGVQTISASNVAIVLTSPSNFTPTPGAGPTQSQNAVLRFTGALTANVQVTLPLPGFYILENLTTGNFVLSFRALGSGEVIGIDQGEVQHVYNDGTNVRFVNLGRIGHIELWAGYTALPAWVTACTKLPFLLCDGTVYSASTYPYLAAKLGGAFGGNGTTTFAVPDLRGRVALPYDGTGTRITSAGCGLNGQTLGAVLDEQTITLQQSGLPNVSPTFTGSSSSGSTSGAVLTYSGGNNFVGVAGGGGGVAPSSGAGSMANNPVGVTVTPSGTVGSINGGVTQTATPNVQPSQVTGIAVIRAA